jgi:Tol biopolymer transport system component
MRYLARASLAALALAGALMPAAAAARLHGRIVFVSERRLSLTEPPGEAVWTMRADGTHARRLTRLRNLVLDGDPVWSPSGRWIAFGRSDHGHTSIWLMTAGGRRAHRLISDGMRPAWSPAGGWIAFTRSDPNSSNGTVWVVRPDGSQANPIGTGGQPAWSPDGKRLVAATEETDDNGSLGQGKIDVFNLDGSGRRTLFASPERGHPYSPAWSPNGRQIVFTRDFFVEGSLGELWSIPSAGGDAARLARNADRAAFSPSGRKIVFVTERRLRQALGGFGFEDGLDVVNADGRSRHPIAGQRHWARLRTSLEDPDWHR